MMADELPPTPGGKVISLADAAKSRAAEETPSSSAGANAPDAGAGGEPSKPGKPKPAPKKEMTVDYGVFNSLIENWALIYGTDTVWDGQRRHTSRSAAAPTCATPSSRARTARRR